MLRHEYKCLFAYFRNLFIEIFRIVMFILIFYPLGHRKLMFRFSSKFWKKLGRVGGFYFLFFIFGIPDVHQLC